ncbi:MAG TPA: four helix bundle protein [bacterium]|nr:four helix bundle protein [bacterium]
MGANSVEAKASSSRKEYIKFFEIALKSANETIYWLMVIREVVSEPVEKAEIAELLQEIKEIASILGSSVITLKGKNKSRDIQFIILIFDL